jgi:hypothetical protein
VCWAGISLTFYLDWPRTSILPIFTSQVLDYRCTPPCLVPI